MLYLIKPRTKSIAHRLGVTIQPSHRPTKKIDVLLPNKTISIGQRGAMDYPSYLEQDPSLAKKKQEQYKARHERDRHLKDSAGWWADKLLWS